MNEAVGSIHNAVKNISKIPLKVLVISTLTCFLSLLHISQDHLLEHDDGKFMNWDQESLQRYLKWSIYAFVFQSWHFNFKIHENLVLHTVLCPCYFIFPPLKSLEKLDRSRDASISVTFTKCCIHCLRYRTL
jgi:hypothetical protein